LASELLEVIPGFEYHGHLDKCSFPIRNANMLAEFVEDKDISLTSAIRGSRFLKKWQKQEKWRRQLSDTVADTSHILSHFNVELDKNLPPGKKLMPHQGDCIAFFEAANGRALCCDDPGLGKTPPAILYTANHNYSTIVMGPKNVLFNWAIEIAMWAPDKSIFVLTNATKKDTAKFNHFPQIKFGNKLPEKQPDYFVMSYHRADRICDEITSWTYDATILDECHMLKNWQAKMTESSVVIAQFSRKCIIGLTGTPIRNRPEEFFTILNLIRPNEFPEWKDYIKRYCGGVKNHWGGWEYSGATNMEELYDKLKSVMIRRNKDVINLPPKEIIYTNIKYGSQKVLTKSLIKRHYNQAGGPLKIISLLKQDAALKKVQHLKVHVSKFLNDLPVVIFYHHKEIGTYLENTFNSLTSVAKIDGSTSDIDRSVITAEFQAGKHKVLLASITAAGIGITLTAASRAIMFEQAWSPADERQCHDRLHRIGQTKPVIIEYLIGEDTVDEVIQKVVKEKSEMIDSIIDGASVKSVMVRNVMQELMK